MCFGMQMQVGELVAMWSCGEVCESASSGGGGGGGSDVVCDVASMMWIAKRCRCR